MTYPSETTQTENRRKSEKSAPAFTFGWLPWFSSWERENRKEKENVYNNENQTVSGTHLVYIFIFIAQIHAITKPVRFDCKLQTEGLINTYGHTVRRQDIQFYILLIGEKTAEGLLRNKLITANYTTSKKPSHNLS